MKILGIDTSCDETAAAVVADGRKVLSNVVASQVEVHQEYGGVVPELASRKHIEAINYIVSRALAEADVAFKDLEAIAVTNRPGLIGALLVGVAAAKSLAYCHNLPLLGINHIEGHIYANYMVHDTLTFPHICLTVSGGHTQLVEVHEGWQYKVLGGTQDDAAGEVYDKVAKYLGLGFPGGKIIDDLAQKGDPSAIKFPRPMRNSGDYQFSFSGIKTSVRYFVEKARRANILVEGENGNAKDTNPDMVTVEDIAASFQAAVVDVLVYKSLHAAKATSAKAITLTGGVAANSELRASLKTAATEIGAEVYYPPMNLCTDNGAMIAGIAYEKYQQGLRDGLSLNAAANGSIVDV
ncbi:MAG: tRNA (adenosine(37)-N6)-threonylcarbamoyltransferase complex transferase subunit TsaD [Candidatus Poribacteria bacterium]|nr:tRNA (adenosine(37)-N6)-threonylcarbamoyltransferase complex transferase subunit TsaD [Candidatus Poribacteria bacterium]